MRRLSASLACLCLLTHLCLLAPHVSEAGEAAGSSRTTRSHGALPSAGRTPDGDFDLEVELEIEPDTETPTGARGRIFLEQRSGRPACGIQLRGAAAPALFREGVLRAGREPGGRPVLSAGRHKLVARRREGPEGLASFCLELDGRAVDVLYAPMLLRVDAVERDGTGPEGGKPGEGVARYGGGALSGARIVKLSMHRVQAAFFDDEFNWEAPEAGGWEPLAGEWGLATTRDAWIAVDRGPFATSSYAARAAGLKRPPRRALSLARPRRVGRVYVSVAVKIPEGAEAGIAFGVAKSGTRRAMRALVVKPGPGGKGSARLVLRTASGEKTLAGPAAAYVRAGAWTRLEIWSDWDYVRAELPSADGGRVVLEADVSDCPAGRVGLVAGGTGPVLFDDFELRPWHVVHERRAGERVRWATASGGRIVPELRWPAGGFRLEVRTGRGPPFPVPGPAGLASFWEPDRLGPKAALLALDVRGPHAAAFVHGRPRFEAILERPPDGPPGILSSEGTGCERIVLEPSRRPLEVNLFSNDFSAPAVRLPYGRGVVRVVGDVLKPVSGRWSCVKRGKESFLWGKAEGTGLIVFSRPCPGDVRVEAGVVRLQRSTPGQAGVFIAAGKHGGGGLRRYSLSVEPTAEHARGAQLVLRRTGVKVAGCALPDAEAGARDAPRHETEACVALERRGRHLFGWLGDELLLRWRDAEPLDGDAVGLFVTKGEAEFARASLTHLRATRSDFRRVDPRWQPLSGEWLMHTGLACIPWDHWITAFGSPKEPAYAGLFPPAAFGPDVCVALRVSEASEGFENRTHVHYPLHDVSVTLRGDPGKPERRGYRFLIAPLPGKDCVVLFRNGEEVAREASFRLVMGGHNNQPREFTLVARSRGGALSCSINGREVLRWRDPAPLGAGHVVILGAEKGRANLADVTVMDVTRYEIERHGRNHR